MNPSQPESTKTLSYLNVCECRNRTKQKMKTPAIVAFGDMFRRNKDPLPKPKSLILCPLSHPNCGSCRIAYGEEAQREKEKKKIVYLSFAVTRNDERQSEGLQTEVGHTCILLPLLPFLLCWLFCISTPLFDFYIASFRGFLCFGYSLATISGLG